MMMMKWGRVIYRFIAPYNWCPSTSALPTQPSPTNMIVQKGKSRFDKNETTKKEKSALSKLITYYTGSSVRFQFTTVFL